ncbi:hypothetical protein O181_031088 [Austropuccinia psidii MF-1]|uniref:Uncharacterized protein n=1 Tax=Austropuccinia psidii MF-1 TaxID=1389203 RepID=A0A9Q3CWS4_9BASI|nr:hypothetical protein [Austropuccinia psidii MF-1]
MAYQILITAIFSSETCQLFITFLDSEQVICTTQINIAEDRGTTENSKKLIHRRNRILVLPSNRIEFAVINTQMEATIFLFDKEDSTPVEEELGKMKHISTFSEMCGEEEVSLLLPWRIHPSTGDKQKEQPSSRFLFLLALPLHPTTPPGSHDKMKGEEFIILNLYSIKNNGACPSAENYSSSFDLSLKNLEDEKNFTLRLLDSSRDNDSLNFATHGTWYQALGEYPLSLDKSKFLKDGRPTNPKYGMAIPS